MPYIIPIKGDPTYDAVEIDIDSIASACQAAAEQRYAGHPAEHIGRTPMKPAISRTVIVLNHGCGAAPEAPAVITRVWGQGDPAIDGPQAVNLHVLPDCHEPRCMTSVPLFESRASAEAYLERLVGHTPPIVAFWPDPLLPEPQPRISYMLCGIDCSHTEVDGVPIEPGTQSCRGGCVGRALAEETAVRVTTLKAA